MSSKKLDLSKYRIGAIAKALNQPAGAIKLCLNGPRQNVDQESIASIGTIDRARTLMRRAKSRERKRRIAAEWLGLCTRMEELREPFNGNGCPDLFLDDDLRHIRDLMAHSFAAQAIEDGTFDGIYNCWEHCPRGYVKDELLLALVERVSEVDSGMRIIDKLEKDDQLLYPASNWTYWTVMLKMAELADVQKAYEILAVIVRHRRFDYENPAVALLVRKIAEEYKC